jgi:DNA-binding NarL/FixJ family response regulator
MAPSLESLATDSLIHVWIVEDNGFLRDTIVELFAQRSDMRCTVAVSSCEEALAVLERGLVPQVLFMDLELPGMSGLQGIARVKAISPATHVIVLTVHEDNDKVFEALCAGASGYLLKPASGDRIVEAVESALHGGAPMNAFIARRVLDMLLPSARKDNYGLTDREREILQMLVDANSQKQIARLLSLSPHTVDTHLRNIYAKLHVHSRAGAVAKALQERLL